MNIPGCYDPDGFNSSCSQYYNQIFSFFHHPLQHRTWITTVYLCTWGRNPTINGRIQSMHKQTCGRRCPSGSMHGPDQMAFTGIDEMPQLWGNLYLRHCRITRYYSIQTAYESQHRTPGGRGVYREMVEEEACFSWL